MALFDYTSVLPDKIDVPLIDEDFDESFTPKTVNFNPDRDIVLMEECINSRDARVRFLIR